VDKGRVEGRGGFEGDGAAGFRAEQNRTDGEEVLFEIVAVSNALQGSL
jgi:hypothetical protein